MYKNRRDFLRLAGRTCLISTLATASGVRALPGRDTDVEPPPLSAIAMHRPNSTNSAALDVDLVRRIKAISNAFEVGGSEPDYAYLEDLGDGRGYTVTQYGFCTYNDEVARVIGRYARFVPDTDLKRFLPYMPPLAAGKQAPPAFPAAWRKEIARSEYLKIACDEEEPMSFTSVLHSKLLLQPVCNPPLANPSSTIPGCSAVRVTITTL